MNWFMGTEDREQRHWRLQEESIAHEMKWEQDLKVGWRESTPLGEEVPKSLGMDYIARLRHQKLEEETEKVRDIWKTYNDEIQL